ADDVFGVPAFQYGTTVVPNPGTRWSEFVNDVKWSGAGFVRGTPRRDQRDRPPEGAEDAAGLGAAGRRVLHEQSGQQHSDGRQNAPQPAANRTKDSGVFQTQPPGGLPRIGDGWVFGHCWVLDLCRWDDGDPVAGQSGPPAQ